MTDNVISLEYAPRDAFIPFHNRDQRFAAMVIHRRAGKTVAAIHDLIIKALRCTRSNPRFFYVAPFYAQAKSIAWLYLTDATRDFAVEIRQSELSVELPNGAIIRLFGADNPDSLRGLYADGVVLDEFANFRPNLFGEVILPLLADREGWLLAIGTPAGRMNSFFEICEKAKKSPEWYFLALKASESGIIPKAELDMMRDQMSEDQYLQEFEVSFDAALVGTYYTEQISKMELDGRVSKEFDYDPNFPVNTACDIGITDSSVFWFWQDRPDGICVFDIHHNNSVPLQHYFDTLNSKPYKYKKVWLPHDARAKSLQTGKSTVEQFLEAGFPVDITPSLRVIQGIDAVRATFPQVYLHTRCAYGLEMLRIYRKKWDSINKCFLNTPLHDQSSDFADAFRYLCLVANAETPTAVSQKPSIQEQMKKPQEYRLDELFESNETRGELRHILRIN